MSEVRNQLKSQDLSTLEATSLSTVGGRVFPDNAAGPDLRALIEVARAWGATHAPANGGPIGGTDDVSTHTMSTSDEAVFTPTGKQLAQVSAVSIANGGGAPMIADLKIGGVVVDVGVNVDPSGAKPFELTVPLIVGPSTPVQVNLSEGTAADATVKVAYVLVGV